MVTAVAAAILGLSGTAVAAAPPPHDPIPPQPGAFGYGFGAEQPGNHGGGGPGADGTGAESGDGPDDSIEPHVCDQWIGELRVCRPVPAEPGAGAGVTPAQLAIRTWERLPIPGPRVRTAPPRSSDGLVGLPHWFWVTNWSPRSARAVAGAVWAEVTARPMSMRIEPGRGQLVVVCRGPGAAYDPSRPAGAQRTDCSYTYDRSSSGLPRSAYRATVTVTWGGTWVGSGGAGGGLPPLSRSSSFPVRVAEAQALIQRSA